VRFFPAPARLPGYLYKESLSPKAFKRVRWISPDILQSLVAGHVPPANPENFLHDGTVWLSDQEFEIVKPQLQQGLDGRRTLWREQIIPHAAIDRASGASALFHAGRVTFSRDCGLWFAVDQPGDSLRDVIHFLSDSGLGGLRSTGHGAFTFTESDEPLAMTQDAWGLCLSRFAPATSQDIVEGLQSRSSAYRLVTVGGWCQDDTGRPWRRRNVRLIAEGAILPANVTGGIVDVRPDKVPQFANRPVYRYGLPYLIPAGRLAEAI
jgi:CRISPR type III-A-associated RAMP protein Csm4